MVYKTFWLRVAAAFIDSFLLWPLLAIQAGKGGDSLVIVSLILVLQHSYYVIGVAQYGQTLGKRILGLKVVRAHHHLPVSWMHAFMRESLWIAVTVIYSFAYFKTAPHWTIIPGYVVIFADVLTALVHPQHRSIRDFMAKTVVVRTL